MFKRSNCETNDALDSINLSSVDFDVDPFSPHLLGAIAEPTVCLCCGKQCEGTSELSKTFTHFLDTGHSFFAQLLGGKVLSLPDLDDASDDLEDVKRALHPTFPQDYLASIDKLQLTRGSADVTRPVASLLAVNASPPLDAVLASLGRCHVFRDQLLEDDSSNIMNTYLASFMQRLWNPYAKGRTVSTIALNNTFRQSGAKTVAEAVDWVVASIPVVRPAVEGTLAVNTPTRVGEEKFTRLDVDVPEAPPVHAEHAVPRAATVESVVSKYRGEGRRAEVLTVTRLPKVVIFTVAREGVLELSSRLKSSSFSVSQEEVTYRLRAATVRAGAGQETWVSHGGVLHRVTSTMSDAVPIEDHNTMNLGEDPESSDAESTASTAYSVPDTPLMDHLAAANEDDGAVGGRFPTRSRILQVAFQDINLSRLIDQVTSSSASRLRIAPLLSSEHCPPAASCACGVQGHPFVLVGSSTGLLELFDLSQPPPIRLTALEFPRGEGITAIDSCGPWAVVAMATGRVYIVQILDGTRVCLTLRGSSEVRKDPTAIAKIRITTSVETSIATVAAQLSQGPVLVYTFDLKKLGKFGKVKPVGYPLDNKAGPPSDFALTYLEGGGLLAVAFKSSFNVIHIRGGTIMHLFDAPFPPQPQGATISVTVVRPNIRIALGLGGIVSQQILREGKNGIGTIERHSDRQIPLDLGPGEFITNISYPDQEFVTCTISQVAPGQTSFVSSRVLLLDVKAAEDPVVGNEPLPVSVAAVPVMPPWTSHDNALAALNLTRTISGAKDWALCDGITILLASPTETVVFSSTLKTWGDVVEQLMAKRQLYEAVDHLFAALESSDAEKQALRSDLLKNTRQLVPKFVTSAQGLGTEPSDARVDKARVAAVVLAEAFILTADMREAASLVSDLFNTYLSDAGDLKLHPKSANAMLAVFASYAGDMKFQTLPVPVLTRVLQYVKAASGVDQACRVACCLALNDVRPAEAMLHMYKTLGLVPLQLQDGLARLLTTDTTQRSFVELSIADCTKEAFAVFRCLADDPEPDPFLVDSLFDFLSVSTTGKLLVPVRLTKDPVRTDALPQTVLSFLFTNVYDFILNETNPALLDMLRMRPERTLGLVEAIVRAHPVQLPQIARITIGTASARTALGPQTVAKFASFIALALGRYSEVRPKFKPIELATIISIVITGGATVSEESLAALNPPLAASDIAKLSIDAPAILASRLVSGPMVPYHHSALLTLAGFTDASPALHEAMGWHQQSLLRLYYAGVLGRAEDTQKPSMSAPNAIVMAQAADNHVTAAVLCDLVRKTPECFTHLLALDAKEFPGLVFDYMAACAVYHESDMQEMFLEHCVELSDRDRHRTVLMAMTVFPHSVEQAVHALNRDECRHTQLDLVLVLTASAFSLVPKSSEALQFIVERSQKPFDEIRSQVTYSMRDTDISPLLNLLCDLGSTSQDYANFIEAFIRRHMKSMQSTTVIEVCKRYDLKPQLSEFYYSLGKPVEAESILTEWVGVALHGYVTAARGLCETTGLSDEDVAKALDLVLPPMRESVVHSLDLGVKMHGKDENIAPRLWSGTITSALAMTRFDSEVSNIPDSVAKAAGRHQHEIMAVIIETLETIMDPSEIVGILLDAYVMNEESGAGELTLSSIVTTLSQLFEAMSFRHSAQETLCLCLAADHIVLLNRLYREQRLPVSVATDCAKCGDPLITSYEANCDTTSVIPVRRLRGLGQYESRATAEIPSVVIYMCGHAFHEKCDTGSCGCGL
ncbi:U4/U6.U5 tri-snRNP-associated protein 2 [Carpediemonas membranifera]|uniref:U4/U6.U5 tri-snRNP-associated protein 2 n=1 Tax=Carpediemonas membranifera TaxID=201153 RepID=A0A8J6E1D6_9EUKA|nr:U4/U6.U5 tri-snRNP-associated protein 2 [Carpediemonas membranifera]|eukprot:KAG9393338.1 U4/U6.U5 tri-snRNP-associated protein 2 [Carpediemonas membranifera]